MKRDVKLRIKLIIMGVIFFGDILAAFHLAASDDIFSMVCTLNSAIVVYLAFSDGSINILHIMKKPIILLGLALISMLAVINAFLIVEAEPMLSPATSKLILSVTITGIVWGVLATSLHRYNESIVEYQDIRIGQMYIVYVFGHMRESCAEVVEINDGDGVLLKSLRNNNGMLYTKDDIISGEVQLIQIKESLGGSK